MDKSIKRGDVYWIDFDPPRGRRPTVVIQNDIGNEDSGTIIVATITTALRGKSYPTDVVLPDGILPQKNSRVLAGTIITIKKEDLGDYETSLPPDIMEQIDSALRVSLALDN